LHALHWLRLSWLAAFLKPWEEDSRASGIFSFPVFFCLSLVTPSPSVSEPFPYSLFPFPFSIFHFLVCAAPAEDTPWRTERKREYLNHIPYQVMEWRTTTYYLLTIFYMYIHTDFNVLVLIWRKERRKLLNRDPLLLFRLQLTDWLNDHWFLLSSLEPEPSQASLVACCTRSAQPSGILGTLIVESRFIPTWLKCG